MFNKASYTIVFLILFLTNFPLIVLKRNRPFTYTQPDGHKFTTYIDFFDYDPHFRYIYLKNSNYNINANKYYLWY